MLRTARLDEAGDLARLINDAFVVEAFFKIGDRTSAAEIIELMKAGGEFLVLDDTEPGTGNRHLGTGNRHLGTGNRHLGTGNRHPGTGNRDPGTGNRHPGTGNRDPGTGNRDPGTGNRHPGTGNRHPGTGNPEPGTLSGCVYLKCGGARAYFGMLSIDPPKQGRGLGRRLIDAAEARARERGCRYMDIHIVDLREELPPYYRRFGYVESGRAAFSDPGRASRPCSFIVMTKVL